MTPAEEHVERSAWLALVVATVAAFLTVVDVSVVNVAFPSIAADLEVERTDLSWVISGYNVTLASLLLIAGRLADRRGRRRVFIVGLSIFLLGSLLSGLSQSSAQLVAARVVQATGGALLTPASLAMVLPRFPLSKRSTAIGIWGAMGALGAAFGPSIGAVLIELTSWRAIFLINVPLGLVLLAAVPRFVAESRDETATGPLDLIGVPVGSIGVALVMVGIVRSEELGWVDPAVLAFFAAGGLLLPVVVWRSARHPAPLLDLHLFEQRSFAVAIGSFTVYALGFTAGFLVNSILLQQYWGMSVLEAGFGLTPGPILATGTSIVVGRLADRLGHRWLCAGGAALCSLGYLVLILGVGPERQYLAVFLPSALIVGVGVGATIATFQSAALSEVAHQQFAIANATMRTGQQVGYAIGISVVIALLGSNLGVPAFDRAYTWITLCFAGAAVLMAVFYPRGSAADRRLDRGSRLSSSRAE